MPLRRFVWNRAANGVVLITTKSGRGSDRPTITLQINQGIYNRGIPEYERLGANQWNGNIMDGVEKLCHDR